MAQITVTTKRTSLSQQVMSKTDTSKVIISGDWNITLNRIDKLGGLPWKATSCRNTLVDLMDELNLTDIYRELHPKSKSFTYVSKSLNLKSRIDYFRLISRSLSCDVWQAEIRISTAPDHNAIFLSIDVKSEFSRGPGLWKFNNTLLEDSGDLKHYGVRCLCSSRCGVRWNEIICGARISRLTFLKAKFDLNLACKLRQSLLIYTKHVPLRLIICNKLSSQSSICFGCQSEAVFIYT